LPRLKDLPLPYTEVAQLGWKIATALDDLHRQNVIHLDIKPSNVLFRPSGEAVLIDFGLSRHLQLPDLMQEEFHLPYGTAPYMAPEQLQGVRHDYRSDQFALGVLLYFFSTGERPFGESERLSIMKQRLWRDPKPPKMLRPDYPSWLQEIVLRCLEVEPAARYPSAAHLAFELSNHSQIKLTARARRRKPDSFFTVLKRRFNPDFKKDGTPRTVATPVPAAPIVAVAVDLSGDTDADTNAAVRDAALRALAQVPGARLACLNVLKQSFMPTLDSALDEEGHNKHVNRLVALQHWAQPLKLREGRITFHVLEAADPAQAILAYAQQNRVDHIVIAARRNPRRRALMGAVCARIASEAACTVTVVRPRRATAAVREEDMPAPEETANPV
jgi:eukaryotic-like serine/threonine-protein kinase